jgi:hypothetical protein
VIHVKQASYITGGVYVKPQHLDGLFQYLTVCFNLLVYYEKKVHGCF